MNPILQAMYDYIDQNVEMECPEGCSKCCGPVLALKEEQDNMGTTGSYGKGCVPYDKETLACSQLHNGKCLCYDHRPLICRAFGSVPDPNHILWCPHATVKKTPFTYGDFELFMEAYFKMMNAEGIGPNDIAMTMRDSLAHDVRTGMMKLIGADGKEIEL